jgi:predicted RecA/RadA family phage recombinase
MTGTAYSIPGHPQAPTLAGADLSANANRFVKAHTTEGQHVAIAAATDLPSGLQLDAPSAAGQSLRAVQFGIYEVISGAAVAHGARIQTDSSGRAITAVATGYVVGYALQAAENAGERIACFINCVNPPLMA